MKKVPNIETGRWAASTRNQTPFPIIGLFGHQYAGKTTVAKHLESVYHFKRIPFAGPLKSMLKAVGLTDEDLDGSMKKVPHPLLCGKTPREAMQTLGTEWGRNMIGETVWTTLWLDACAKARADGFMGVVCDDLRFPDEETFLRTLNSTLVKVWRDPDAEKIKHTHASEQHYLGMTPDLTLDNSGGWEHTSAQIARWFGNK